MAYEAAPGSRRHQVRDPDDAIEYCYRQGWTDGLPVVPPTEARVRSFLAAVGLEPGALVAEVPERARTIRAEKLAINAVMAGCLPEYAPVLVKAVEALCAREHNLNGTTASTDGSAPLLIVTGPMARRIGMNGGANLFGPGNRANATIGRAIRLLLMNVCGATPGGMDRSCMGHPGKYSFCITEAEDLSPWPPFHTQRGLPPEASAVTVFAGGAPLSVNNQRASGAEAVLRPVAWAMAAATMFRGGGYVVILGPEHAAVVARDGWGPDRVREYLARGARATVADLKRQGRLPGDPAPGDDVETRSAVEGPEEVLLLVAGGNAGSRSAVIPPWDGGHWSTPVTRRIE